MLLKFQDRIRSLITTSLQPLYPHGDIPAVDLEVPSDKAHGDFSTNIALKSVKLLKKPPMELAASFCEAFFKTMESGDLADMIEKIEPVKPGFINFHLSRKALGLVLEEVLKEKSQYGRCDFGQGRRVNIEFVSANPTGPLSVAHARQAAVGDALANIFNAIGFSAVKEFYVNDEGNQINILGKSVYLRALERLGEKREFPEDCYQGQYIYEMADTLLASRKVRTVAELEALPAPAIAEFSATYLLEVIKEELKDFGVRFDVWSHQSAVAGPDKIKETIGRLTAQGHLYEQDGALWFKSTAYGDDKDRVVKKSDGSYTYFMPDIVYHEDKFRRGFEKIFNLWGPDHHGYIPRLTAAVEALGKPRDALKVIIVQLATLFRDGQPVKMSTRFGQYVTLREVMEEVGVDAARFFFLMRLVDAHLDFDLELAKKETPENPVYYIQYAHARTYAIEEKANLAGLHGTKSVGFKHFTEPEELELIKKLGHFPNTLLICWRQSDVFALVNYLQDLAGVFHRFYDRNRVIDPQNPELSTERLALVYGARIVIANGLQLLGVSAPKKM